MEVCGKVPFGTLDMAVEGVSGDNVTSGAVSCDGPIGDVPAHLPKTRAHYLGSHL